MAAPVSARWEGFIRRGYHPITVVDVTFPGQGVVFANLPVSSGNIQFDRTAANRSSGSLVIPDPTLFPALHADSPIAPSGAELVIKTGIKYPEGDIELVQMGVYRIKGGSGSEAAGNVTSVEFVDRSSLVARLNHIAPKDYGGQPIFTVLTEILTDPIPTGLSWSVIIDTANLTNITLPAGTMYDTDAWSFVQKLCESIGAEAYFDRNGDAQVVKVPGITSAHTIVDADWIIDAGEDGILIDVERSISDEDVFNGIVVTGSADEDRPAPFAFATDDNPASPTFYGGPFGKSVQRIENSDLTTDAQCLTAAKAELRNTTGLKKSVSFSSIGNPAMDAGDIILIRSQPPAVDEIHLLDNYTFDFVTAEVSGGTRAIQYVEESP